MTEQELSADLGSGEVHCLPRSRGKLWLMLAIPITLLIGAGAYGFSYYSINETLAKLEECGGQYMSASEWTDRPEWLDGKFLPGFDCITHLYATGDDFDSAMLKSLCRHADLEELTLAETSVTDAGLAAISDQTEMIRLRIADPQRGLIRTLPNWDETPKLRILAYDTKIIDTSFWESLSRCTALETLTLSSAESGERSEVDLSSLTTLKTFEFGQHEYDFDADPDDLTCAGRVTDDWLIESIASIPNLQQVVFIGVCLEEPNVLSRIASAQSITDALLYECRWGDAEYRAMAAWRQLQDVCVSRGRWTAEDSVRIAQLPYLRSLGLRIDDGVLPDAIRALDQCQKLTALRFRETSLWHDLLAGVNDIDSLEFLSLDERSFDLHDLVALRESPSLRRIGIDSMEEPSYWRDRLDKMGLKQLEFVTDSSELAPWDRYEPSSLRFDGAFELPQIRARGCFGVPGMIIP